MTNILVSHSASYNYSVQSNVKLSFGYPKLAAAKFGAAAKYNTPRVVARPYLFNGYMEKLKIYIECYNLHAVSSILGGAS